MCCATQPPQLPKCAHTGFSLAGCGRSITDGLPSVKRQTLARQRIAEEELLVIPLGNAVALGAEASDLELDALQPSCTAPSRNS